MKDKQNWIFDNIDTCYSAKAKSVSKGQAKVSVICSATVKAPIWNLFCKATAAGFKESELYC